MIATSAATYAEGPLLHQPAHAGVIPSGLAPSSVLKCGLINHRDGVATYVPRHVSWRRPFISALALELWNPAAGRTGVADRQQIRRQPDVGAALRRDLDLGRVRKLVSANDIDGGVMALDQGALAGLTPTVSVRAIEARRGVYSDRHQAKLRITEGGTGHNAPWSGGAEGLFRPNKIRGFLKQIDAGWEMVAPEDKMGFQRPETIPALAAIAEPLITGRPRHLAFAHETPRVIVLPVTPPAAERIAQILDSRGKL